MRVGKPAKIASATLLFGLALAGQPAAATIDVPPEHAVLQPVAPANVDAQRLQRRTDRAWQASALGSRKSLLIDAYGPRDKPVVDRSADLGLMPASTTKIATAAAVLEVLGPDSRFETSVLKQGDRIVLVGGGDPGLTSSSQPDRPGENASLVRLARETAQALRGQGITTVRLDYDVSLFAAPEVPPFWGDDFLRLGIVAPIGALMVDGGRVSPAAAARAKIPARLATERFAALLARRGIDVVGAAKSVVAAGEPIAAVASAPLYALVEHMLLVSDNTAADVLAHHVGRKVLKDPTFTGGGRATVQVLGELGVDTAGMRLEDGSGLARANRISASQLVAVLRLATDEPDRLWPVFTGLPVAGFDGSLTYRFRTPRAAQARGAVTGKTGTLTGTSTLAGLIADRDGQLLYYAIMTNDVAQWSASAAIDELLARAAGCRCVQSSEQSVE